MLVVQSATHYVSIHKWMITKKNVFLNLIEVTIRCDLSCRFNLGVKSKNRLLNNFLGFVNLSKSDVTTQCKLIGMHIRHKAPSPSELPNPSPHSSSMQSQYFHAELHNLFGETKTVHHDHQGDSIPTKVFSGLVYPVSSLLEAVCTLHMAFL